MGRRDGDVEDGAAEGEAAGAVGVAPRTHEGLDDGRIAAGGLEEDHGVGDEGDSATQPLDTRGWTRADVVEHLCNKFRSSDLCERAKDPGPLPPPLQASHGEESRKYPTSWLNQFVVLFSRSFFYKLREPIAVATQALTSVFMCFVIGSIYWQIGLDQQRCVPAAAAAAGGHHTRRLIVLSAPLPPAPQRQRPHCGHCLRRHPASVHEH